MSKKKVLMRNCAIGLGITMCMQSIPIYAMEDYSVKHVQTELPITYERSEWLKVPFSVSNIILQHSDGDLTTHSLNQEEIAAVAIMVGDETEIEYFTISYVLNGGIQNEANPQSYLSVNSDIPLKAPSREGYRFAGWYSDAELTQQMNVIPAGSVGNIVVYAKWKQGTTDVTEVFSDIKETDWWYKAVQFVYTNSIMAGMGEVFQPNGKLTREQFVQVLYNNSGKPTVSITNKFPDVKDSWYTNAVIWANENDIANGKGNGYFGVGDNITRQDLALMLYKYAKLNGYDLTTSVGMIEQYADGDQVSNYAKEALDWAITQGIMSGKGTKGEEISTFKLDPQGTATRAECASMMMKLLTKEEQ